MSKNAKFKRHYIIEVEGITTNGFAEEYIDRVLFAVVSGLNDMRKQVSVKTISGEDFVKQYNAE